MTLSSFLALSIVNQGGMSRCYPHYLADGNNNASKPVMQFPSQPHSLTDSWTGAAIYCLPCLTYHLHCLPGLSCRLHCLPYLPYCFHCLPCLTYHLHSLPVSRVSHTVSIVSKSTFAEETRSPESHGESKFSGQSQMVRSWFHSRPGAHCWVSGMPPRHHLYAEHWPSMAQKAPVE